MAPPLPPATRLPTLTSCRPMRPSIGAVMRVNSRLSLGVLHRGPGGVERGRGLAHLLEALVEDALRGEVALTQLGRALHLALSQFEPRLGLRDLGAGRGERDLERARVDDEEKVAFPNDLAVPEVDRVEIAADPGADLDILDARELSGELVPLHELVAERVAHHDLRQRGRRGAPRGAGRLGRSVPVEARSRDGGNEQRQRTRPAHRATGWSLVPGLSSVLGHQVSPCRGQRRRMLQCSRIGY